MVRKCTAHKVNAANLFSDFPLDLSSFSCDVGSEKKSIQDRKHGRCPQLCVLERDKEQLRILNTAAH